MKPQEAAPSSLPYYLLCGLVVSTLLHLTARFPVLGAMRFDALLGVLAMIAGWVRISHRTDTPSQWESAVTRRLLYLFAYIVVTLPFVRWPGSVIHSGLEPFFKAVIFYFLVVWCVSSVRQLGGFLLVFGLCQVFRVLEPLYLHIVDGYWGAFTNMGNWELMDRLSGAPSDIINPNGLAYVIVSTLPLLYFAQQRAPALVRALLWALMATMIYTLQLTGSRSGFLLLLLLLIAWVWTSKYRVASLVMLVVLSTVILAGMSELQRDRYLSIFRSDVPGAESAQGRLDGITGDFKAAMERPLFGHGLGTSIEVNANLRGYGQISHNLYAEVTQELGFVGLGMFLAFAVAALRAGWMAMKVARRELPAPLMIAARALPVLMAANLIFSMASYGLSEYQWYLLAGLAVVTARLAEAMQPVEQEKRTQPRSPWRAARRAATS